MLALARQWRAGAADQRIDRLPSAALTRRFSCANHDMTGSEAISSTIPTSDGLWLLASGPGQDLAELGGEGVGLARLAVLTAEEAAVAAREGDRLGTQALGHRVRAAIRHLAL